MKKMRKKELWKQIQIRDGILDGISKTLQEHLKRIESLEKEQAIQQDEIAGVLQSQKNSKNFYKEMQLKIWRKSKQFNKTK